MAANGNSENRDGTSGIQSSELTVPSTLGQSIICNTNESCSVGDIIPTYGVTSYLLHSPSFASDFCQAYPRIMPDLLSHGPPACRRGPHGPRCPSVAGEPPFRAGPAY